MILMKIHHQWSNLKYFNKKAKLKKYWWKKIAKKSVLDYLKCTKPPRCDVYKVSSTI